MSLSDIQKKIIEFAKSKDINSRVEVRIIDLASEVGELSKEVLKATAYGEKQFVKSEEWQSEVGDVLFSLICIANETDTNLDDCLKYVLDKYEKRFANKGDISSER